MANGDGSLQDVTNQQERIQVMANDNEPLRDGTILFTRYN